MSRRGRAYLIGWLMLLPFLPTGCTPIQKEGKVLRLAHGLDISHTVHRSMEFMAHSLDSLSDGKLQIKIYPSQQLGTERECLELLQIGSLDITKVSAAVLENFAPELKVLSLPYLFTSKAQQHAVLDGPMGADLLKSCTPFRLEGLCFYDAGSRHFYTKTRPVSHPDHLAGLKIRVQESATAISMVQAFGGSPTPISWGELYTALQQGVVDGAENNAPSFYLSRHYEVCKYYSLNAHSMVPDVVLLSSATLSRLSAEEKKWLREAAALSVAYQRGLWEQDEAEALVAVQSAGVELLESDIDAFSAKTAALLDQYAEDPVLGKYINAIRHD